MYHYRLYMYKDGDTCQKFGGWGLTGTKYTCYKCFSILDYSIRVLFIYKILIVSSSVTKVSRGLSLPPIKVGGFSLQYHC